MIHFHRTFAMPNADTLLVPPIGEWARSHLRGVSVDPFARDCMLATHTNDLNPDTLAQHHMDAEDFCLMLAAQGVVADSAIFDPPYSPRQISECYQSVGREVGTKGTQNAALYRRVRDALDRLIRPGGVVLNFGWNTNGMGKGRGYAPFDVLIVQHGGGHNDTLCMAERKGGEDIFA